MRVQSVEIPGQEGVSDVSTKRCLDCDRYVACGGPPAAACWRVWLVKLVMLPVFAAIVVWNVFKRGE